MSITVLRLSEFQYMKMFVRHRNDRWRQETLGTGYGGATDVGKGTVKVSCCCLIENLVIEKKAVWEAACEKNEQGVFELWRDGKIRDIVCDVLVDFVADFERYPSKEANWGVSYSLGSVWRSI